MICREACYIASMRVDIAAIPTISSGAAPRSGRLTGAKPCSGAAPRSGRRTGAEPCTVLKTDAPTVFNDDVERASENPIAIFFNHLLSKTSWV